MGRLEVLLEGRPEPFEVVLPRTPEIYLPLSLDQEPNQAACKYFAAAFDTVVTVRLCIEHVKIEQKGRTYHYEYAREHLSYVEDESHYPERVLALELLSGNVRTYQYPNTFTGADDIYCKWYLSGRKAGDLVRLLSPFLVLKKDHGEFFNQLQDIDDVDIRRSIAEDFGTYVQEYKHANMRIPDGTVLPKEYMAGLFDFKGSISVRDEGELIVICTLPNEDLARYLQDRYQGNIGPHLPSGLDEESSHKGKLIETKPRWQWLASSGRAASFLRDISPYLWLHKDRADWTLLELKSSVG